MSEVGQKLAWYRDRLNDASGKFGYVEICAVTKTQSAETANEAIACGAKIIGENRVQEINEKFALLKGEFRLDLIGQLQTNKVKYIMDKVGIVQSLDRLKLALALNGEAIKRGRRMDVLIEVNVAGEASKTGAPLEELDSLISEVSRMEALRLRGLMAVMPIADDPEDVRTYFRQMRFMFDEARERGRDFDCLSMGMSHDCLVAAQEGATMVRLGTALFGRRV